MKIGRKVKENIENDMGEIIKWLNVHNLELDVKKQTLCNSGQKIKKKNEEDLYIKVHTGQVKEKEYTQIQRNVNSTKSRLGKASRSYDRQKPNLEGTYQNCEKKIGKKCVHGSTNEKHRL